MIYKCPTCKKAVEFPQEDETEGSVYFPFCSQRCRLIDLGAWLDGDYKIAPKTPDQENSNQSNN